MTSPIQKLFEEDDKPEKLSIRVEVNNEDSLIEGLRLIILALNAVKKKYISGVDVEYVPHYYRNGGVTTGNFVLLENINIKYID